MERPNNKIIDEVESLLQDIKEMQKAIPELKHRANQVASQISSLPYDDRLNSAAYLYWIHPEVHAKVIAKATIGAPKIRKFLEEIGHVTAGICCTSCSKDTEITSRENFKSVTTLQNSILCVECEEEKNAKYFE